MTRRKCIDFVQYYVLQLVNLLQLKKLTGLEPIVKVFPEVNRLTVAVHEAAEADGERGEGGEGNGRPPQ